jgi:hypothetical protein
LQLVDIARFQPLIDATIPFNGERFSGWYNTHDVEDYQDIVKYLEGIGHYYELTRYPTACWINVMLGKGAKIERHQEGYNPGDITIVLFINTLGSEDGGILQVEHEDQIKNYVPEQCTHCIFPSDCYHHVTPLNTDKPRISIAALFHKTNP